MGVPIFPYERSSYLICSLPHLRGLKSQRRTSPRRDAGFAMIYYVILCLGTWDLRPLISAIPTPIPIPTPITTTLDMNIDCAFIGKDRDPHLETL